MKVSCFKIKVPSAIANQNQSQAYKIIQAILTHLTLNTHTITDVDCMPASDRDNQIDLIRMQYWTLI